jgi:hypothetical protein
MDGVEAEWEAGQQEQQEQEEEQEQLLWGVHRGAAARYLAGGSEDGPPLDLRQEEEEDDDDDKDKEKEEDVGWLARVAEERWGGSSAAARLRGGAALLCAHLQHCVTGPALPPALALCSERAQRAAARALLLPARCSSALPLLWLARALLFHPLLDPPSSASHAASDAASDAAASDASLRVVVRAAALWRARVLAHLRELAQDEQRRDSWPQELRCWRAVSGHWQEKALALGGQDRWAEALRLVARRKQQLGLRAALSGRLGKRTKYQTFECAQLVLLVERDDPDAEEDDDDEREEEENQKKQALEHDEPEEVKLEPDSILLERGRGEEGEPELTPEQQSVLVLEGLCVARRHARDELTLGLALPYVEQVLFGLVCLSFALTCFFQKVLRQRSCPFAVRSAALFVRSLLEAHMSKTRDRAALQLEALHEGWQRERDGTTAAARLAHVWGCPLPARNALLLETARAYMRIGAVSTAAGMFERLGRVREHMSCLVVAGKPHAAGQLCEDLLASAETARHQRWELLCLLGELREQV